MRVRVLFFGVLKELAGRAQDVIEVEPQTTIGTLFEQYCQKHETLRARRPSILFGKNGEFATADTTLSENDEVAFLPPVSGGAVAVTGDSGFIFALTYKTINSQELARRLQRPEDGAIVIFEGTVRNHTNGRPTRYL